MIKQHRLKGIEKFTYPNHWGTRERPGRYRQSNAFSEHSQTKIRISSSGGLWGYWMLMRSKGKKGEIAELMGGSIFKMITNQPNT